MGGLQNNLSALTRWSAGPLPVAPVSGSRSEIEKIEAARPIKTQNTSLGREVTGFYEGNQIPVGGSLLSLPCVAQAKRASCDVRKAEEIECVEASLYL